MIKQACSRSWLRKEKKKNVNLNGHSFVMLYLESLRFNAVISTNIMFYFGITRISGPKTIFVVILFERGGGFRI